MAYERKKLQWTQHSEIKMRQYGLSKTKLINLLYKPERKEKGIVPGTMAVMKTNKKYSHECIRIPKISFNSGARLHHSHAPGEVWLMYKDTKDQRKIISAWRYPGVSKLGEEIPIPKDIRDEVMKNERTG